MALKAEFWNYYPECDKEVILPFLKILDGKILDGNILGDKI